MVAVALPRAVHPGEKNGPRTSERARIERASPFSADRRVPGEQDTASAQIPPGTILPLRLSTSLSSKKAKTGQSVEGQIMQDIPLAGGRKVPKGTKVLGQIVAVVPAAAGDHAEVSLRFDRLIEKHQTIPMITNLRAIAGFMEVEAAQLPAGLSSGEGEVYRWLPTTQIGGDTVYGKGGIVTKGNHPEEVVGKSTENGVLARISGREGASCRGPLYGNDRPQALWVFSSDACGVYGVPHLEIASAGRSAPVGLIVMRSDHGELKIPSGAGILLRVDEVNSR
jgi:hypothetical protein